MGICQKETHIMLVVSHSDYMRLRVIEEVLNMIIDQSIDQRKRLEDVRFQIAFTIIDKDSGIGSSHIKLIIGQSQKRGHIENNLFAQFPSLGMHKISIEMGIGINPEVALAVHLTQS